MKKLLLVTVLTLLATAVMAQGFTGPGGGQQSGGGWQQEQGGRGNWQVTTVAEALNPQNYDRTAVLTGHIVAQIGRNYFLFRDATGEIRVEIYPRDWQRFGVTVGPNDLVEIIGDIDRSSSRTGRVHYIDDVVSIRIIR